MPFGAKHTQIIIATLFTYLKNCISNLDRLCRSKAGKEFLRADLSLKFRLLCIVSRVCVEYRLSKTPVYRPIQATVTVKTLPNKNRIVLNRT